METRESYEEFFKQWMASDPKIAEYVHSLGYALGGLHNMLYVFYLAGIEHAKLS